MQRIFWAMVLAVLLAESLLALAFWAGYTWLGGLLPGLLLAAALLLLLVLPWLGEVRVAYDSQAQEIRVKVSWWASALVRLAEERELRLRLLGLPLRRKLGRRPPEKTGAAPPAGRPGTSRNLLPQLTRFALAALEAANEVAWATKELTVIANAPAQSEVLDQVIAGALGTRATGPLTLQVRPEGRRRLQVRYRIGLFTLASAALFVLLQGRARRLKRSLQAARKG